jgi:CO/xanthine dehydrogenase Mo-binding subunit
VTIDTPALRSRGQGGSAGAAAPVVAPTRPAMGVGRALPLRREGPEKLTGTARYTDDLVVPGAWYGATIRSTEARAKLLAIDLDPAFAWDRVVVVTADDIPGRNAVEGIAADQPILVPAGGEIRHQAEPVALIAAPDRDTLREARRHVRLRTEALEPVFDPLTSNTVIAHFELGLGDVDAAMAAAEVVVEGTYRVGHQEQLYIENNAMIALPRDDGGITVHGSLQCPYYVHRALIAGLGLDDAHVQVVQAETGGGFGGKEEYPSMIALHASLLARRTGRPVRMIYDRHEDLSATTKRHPAIVHHRTGLTRDGRIVAQDIDLVLDGGAYTTLTPVVLSRATIHAGGPYDVGAVRIRSRAVATNTPPNGAFRGFGAPQAEFAAEMQMNRAAEALGMSPLEIRRLNVYRPAGVTATQQVLGRDVAALEVLERAAEASEFERTRARTAAERAARPAGARTARGIGLALAWHGAGFTGSGEEKMGSVATLELTADGRIRILTASSEMGQGTKTIFPQLVAGELEIDVDEVEMAPQDTSIVPDSGPTVASRTAMVVGGLMIHAARRLKAVVEDRTGRPFGLSYRDDARDHGATRIDQPFVPYPGRHFDDDTYTGDAYPSYGWAAAVAEVEVDLDTAEVAVLSVVAADDVGRVIHPVLCEGQVEGGTLQAVGYATIEEIKLLDGRYLNDRLQTYIIPTSLDAPRIESILVEARFEDAPHGAKGVGELPMDVGAPAVVAAIHDAVGVWIHELPASPERILAALAGIAPPGPPGLSAVSQGASAVSPGVAPAPDAGTP